jgi:hypothetical protein
MDTTPEKNASAQLLSDKSHRKYSHTPSSDHRQGTVSAEMYAKSLPDVHFVVCAVVVVVVVAVVVVVVAAAAAAAYVTSCY